MINQRWEIEGWSKIQTRTSSSIYSITKVILFHQRNMTEVLIFSFIICCWKNNTINTHICFKQIMVMHFFLAFHNKIFSLQVHQNAAARLLTKTKKRAHITAVPASLHLPVCFRIDFKLVLLVFEARNGILLAFWKNISPSMPSDQQRWDFSIFQKWSIKNRWSLILLVCYQTVG